MDDGVTLWGFPNWLFWSGIGNEKHGWMQIAAHGRESRIAHVPEDDVSYKLRVHQVDRNSNMPLGNEFSSLIGSSLFFKNAGCPS